MTNGSVPEATELVKEKRINFLSARSATSCPAKQLNFVRLESEEFPRQANMFM